MIRILGTILAALLGLAFGSFLNVCLSRWPEGESVVKPRSHCRNCARSLAWWENVPLLSWIALRGRCRTCHEKISWRYPLVEFAVGGLWAYIVWHQTTEIALPWTGLQPQLTVSVSPLFLAQFFETIFSKMLFIWLLVALAVLDAENLWLPNWLTWPGILAGCLLTVMETSLDLGPTRIVGRAGFALTASVLGALAAAALILLIRWTYWLVRRREGIGLGDAKLMAMLCAWLGLSGALLSFAIGVVLGSLFAFVVLIVPAARRESDTWLLSKLPLGTFLCIGGIASVLWGQPIIAAYLRWVGL